jgi:hypothetical protein
MAKTQQRAMEMERCEQKAVAKRNVILDKTTLLEKGVKIPNPEQSMWT